MDLKQLLAAEFDRELVLTRKMLNAIPADADLHWKANAKNMTLGRLAAHIAEIPGSWMVDILTKDGLALDLATYKPWSPASKEEILSKFDEDTPLAAKSLATLDPVTWDDTWKMTAGDQVWVSDTRYNVLRTWALNHLIHHRAQLGRDLRTLGAPIPGTYGPSADES